MSARHAIPSDSHTKRYNSVTDFVYAEKERLSKELEYLKGFLKSVDAKLSNERFVQNAKPEIIANERNKKADAESKIKIITESLEVLEG